MKTGNTLAAAIALLALPFAAGAQTPYTLTSDDVTVVDGTITSSTLTNITGNNHHPEIIIPEAIDRDGDKGHRRQGILGQKHHGGAFPRRAHLHRGFCLCQEQRKPRVLAG